MPGHLDITGYAIVSDDDKIAGADGMTPVSLRNEKDWELYQRAQELANLVIFARRSHELEPNIHRSLRLVVSREAPALEQRPDGWWWDPRRTTWEEVAARLMPKGGRVAVGGGQVVFDLFLMIGFDGFHLSRAHGVSSFPADGRSFPPAIRASRPRPCLNNMVSASAKRSRSIRRTASKWMSGGARLDG